MPADLILVRHAESVRPTPGGPSEYVRPLTGEGLRQAEELAPEIVALQPDRIVSSPYLRSIQTIAPAAAKLGLPIEHDEDVREWAGNSAPVPAAEFDDYLRRAWTDTATPAGDGESLDELDVRVATAIDRYRGDGTTILSSHGGWISRALRILGVPADLDFLREMPMPAIYIVSSSGDVTGPGVS